MQSRACLCLVLLAAATACASVTDGPTTPLIRLDDQTRIVAANVDNGEPPPPPIDTGGTMQVDGANFQILGRYFENTQNVNSWLMFQSSEGVIASPNARLMYNPRTLRTKGVGTLTVDTKVIELQFVNITTARGFAACPTPIDVTLLSTSDGPRCDGIVRFTYRDVAGNFLSLHARSGAPTIP